ncbi:MAG TPA: ATPase domain-containing protein [Kofleriaceae bacterium]|jgi:circadian clock protein KaiC|nr:ATPase domain-containing protein [Kofleriaceae bacterium]
MSEHRSLGRIDTGVPGLDTILQGGLFKGGVYIIEGAPGSGKTILGNQICFHRATRGDSTVYITLLAESHTRLIAHLRTMEFFRPELISSSIYYISAFKVLEDSGLEGLLKSIQGAMYSRNATFIVLDGLVSAEEFAPSPRAFKKFIHELQTISGMTGCTVLLLSSTERSGGFRPEHTMVDGLVELGDTVVGVQSLRHVLVRKLRGSYQLRGRHAMEISSAGIKIRPRIETLLRTPDEDDPPPRPVEQADFGVIGLDAMLRGGLPGGSNTIVLGPSGSGKTMLGLQFLITGARVDRVGLYVGFYERPANLLAKGGRLGLGLDAARERGLLHMFWEAPTEGVLDAVVERVLRAVVELGVKRLCFDGLHGFRHHAEYPERTRAVFSALAYELTRRGVTTLFTLESQELVGSSIELPIEGVSSLADNIILLRHVELRSQLYRLISILKVRDRAYDGAIREFRITDRGIVVADTFDSAEQILTGTARIVVEPDPER